MVPVCLPFSCLQWGLNEDAFTPAPRQNWLETSPSWAAVGESLALRHDAGLSLPTMFNI